MQQGTWSGSITPPNSGSVQVTFDVVMAGDTTKITAKGTPAGDLPFSNVRVAADRVTFSFDVGTIVSCTLMTQENGGYKGNCLDSNGDTGVIEMLPPKKGDRP
jgi:hypothetical protein